MGQATGLGARGGDVTDSGIDDAYLVCRAQDGYVDAYEELVRRHGARTYRVALRLLGDHHAAEDVAQEALVTGWRRLASFRGNAQFSTWMYRIVTRLSLSRIQRTRVTESLDLLDAAEGADDSEGPAALAERNLAVDAVSDAITQLSPPQRIVVVLHHLEGLSYEEIAHVTGSTIPAVRSHLFRARRTLAVTLGQWRDRD